MKIFARIALVAGGLLAAAFAASLALRVQIDATPQVDRSGGMSAFGDGIFALAAFAVFAIPAVCAALFFLRSWTPFWKGASVVALTVSAITAAALVVALAHLDTVDGPSVLQLAPLWLLAAPLFGGAFLLAGLFAPAERLRLLLAGVGQFLAFAAASLAVLLSRTG